MKKILVLLLVLAMSVSLLVGCSNEGADKDSTTKVAYVTMDVTSPYFISMINGMKEKAEELGFELTIHDGKYEAQPQIDAIETLIVQDVDVIILSANDPTALQPSVDKAKEAGIKVIAANVEMENTDAYVSLIEKEYGFTGGEIAGKYIAENMNGEAKVAVLAFTQVPAVIQRTEGLKEGILKHAPNAEFVAEVEANNRETGLKAIENILQVNPDLNAVVGVSDDAVLGGYEAMMAAQRVGDDVVLVGLDAVEEAVNKIKEDGIYRGTVDIDPFGSGKIIIETAKKIVDGETIKEMIKFPMIQVTKENISDY
ncbi:MULTISPECIES: sugar ABC transporter substrate-binding protein [Bacillota]|uniref:sugar ABC transporter substrate-binding protein n=1 Tax=Bacillota TaxID=1239 RepID=UPI003F964AA3